MERKIVKFRIQDLLPVALLLVVTAVGMGFGAQVLGDIQNDMTAGSNEAAVVSNGTQSLLNVSVKLPTLGTIIAASIIIGVLVTFLAARAR